MTADRKEFEQWYVENAFFYERDPIGSRDCGLQWAAWQAARQSGDAARLDWLQSQWRDAVHVEVCAKGDGSTWHAMRPAASAFVGSKRFDGETLREAIDAAMKSQVQPLVDVKEPKNGD